MTKRKASAALDTGDESDQSNATQDNNSNNSNSTTNTTNHQQQVGRQNEVPPTGSGGVACDNGNGSQKSKKERADNWSSAEIQVLHRGIDSRRDIFYGPPNQATKKNRELAWEEITKEVNSVSTTPRSLGQVMKKFKNEKCRAKRKFIDAEKEGHNNLGNNSNNNVNNSNNTTNNHTSLNAQNHTSNQQLQSQQQHQQQQQSHHMTTAESMSSQPSSINVVKLAPQNVAKTMIDLPGHVQQIQMPNDDMVLIVPPEMDGLLSGMNIVSDGSQQHNHHGQHTLQAINTGQGLVNGSMSNGMMTRTIPAGSMCSLVYSTGGEICSDQHLAGSVANQNQISTNHIGVNAQNLMHHRSSIEQNQGHQQPQHQQQHQPPHHHLHQHPQMQQEHPASHQQQQQQQQQHPHQSHQPAQHHQHHIQQNHVNPAGAIATPGGVPVESQLKNLLFNLLLKDGQHSIPALNSSQEHKKQRNDMLAVIASSLSKIESHLSKISKVASSLFSQNITNSSNDNGSISTSTSLNVSNTSLTISNSDGTNNSTGISGGGNGGNLNSQGGAAP